MRNKRIFCLRLLLLLLIHRLFLPSLCRRAALSVCCSFYCVLERHDSGSTNICLFRRSVFFEYTSKTFPDDIAIHTQTERKRIRWSMRCVCVCLSIIFLQKNRNKLNSVCFFLALVSLFSSEIIYISDNLAFPSLTTISPTQFFWFRDDLSSQQLKASRNRRSCIHFMSR